MPNSCITSFQLYFLDPKNNRLKLFLIRAKNSFLCIKIGIETQMSHKTYFSSTHKPLKAIITGMSLYILIKFKGMFPT